MYLFDERTRHICRNESVFAGEMTAEQVVPFNWSQSLLSPHPPAAQTELDDVSLLRQTPSRVSLPPGGVMRKRSSVGLAVSKSHRKLHHIDRHLSRFSFQFLLSSVLPLECQRLWSKARLLY